MINREPGAANNPPGSYSMSELQDLYRERGKLSERISALEEQAHSAECQPLVGRHFRYRNSYSCPDTDADYWWLYVKVTGRNGRRLTGLSFERDKNGQSRVDPDWGGYIANGGYEEITEQQWHAALGTFMIDLHQDISA